MSRNIEEGDTTLKYDKKRFMLRVQQSFYEAVDTALKEEILSLDAINDMQERSVNANTLTVSKKGVSNFYTDGLSFEWRPQFHITQQSVEGFFVELEDARIRSGLDIDDEQFRDVALIMVVFHEFGHLFENYLYSVSYSRSERNSIQEPSLKEEKLYERNRRIEIFQKFVSDEIKSDLSTSGISEGAEGIVVEGIAKTWELMGARKLLEKALGTEESEVLLKTLLGQRNKRYRDYLFIVRIINEQGMSFSEAGVKIDRAKQAMDDDSEVVGHLPKYLGEFSWIREIGYYTPFTVDQMREVAHNLVLMKSGE